MAASVTDLRVVRNTQLLRHQVSEKLRESIFDMRFPPGSRLIERELCESVGVSRTLIREALRELEGEGLVQLTSRGPVVPILTAEDARYIYDVRGALEGLAGRRCAENSSPEIVAALRAALHDVETTYTDEHSSGSQKLAAKSRFYEALINGAANPVLTDLLRMMHGRINLLRATYSSSERTMQSLSEVRGIVRAVEDRKPDEASRLCAEHVRNAAIAAYAVIDARTQLEARVSK